MGIIIYSMGIIIYGIGIVINCIGDFFQNIVYIA